MTIDNEQWLIKFSSRSDPKDIGAIEYAYSLMAKEAGLDVPDTKLFPSRHGVGFFACKRFDRTNQGRVHMHTISGLLHADHRLPSLDYQTIIKATMHLTRNMRECEKLYRQCVFNVLTHNRDDHAKNFSYLMNEQGYWHLSPAYDLTFSSGPAGEHCSMIVGEGKSPDKSHLLELSKVTNIKPNDALNIIDEVQASVQKWSYCAEKSGVTRSSTKAIQTELKNISNTFFKKISK